GDRVTRNGSQADSPARSFAGPIPAGGNPCLQHQTVLPTRLATTLEIARLASVMKKWFLAGRSLARRPAFVAAVVAMLALGIGAYSAMFSLIAAVLLEPLPYPNSNRLVTVFEASRVNNQNNQKVSLIAPARLEDWN